MWAWEPDIRTTEEGCYSVAVQVNLVAIIPFSSPNHHDYVQRTAGSSHVSYSCYVTFISFTFFCFFLFWYYVDVFITVVTFPNVDYTCTQTVVIMVLLE